MEYLDCVGLLNIVMVTKLRENKVNNMPAVAPFTNINFNPGTDK